MEKIIKTLVIFVCWLLFLLCTHIVCLDPFGTSVWYFYALAFVFALLQYILLLLLQRSKSGKLLARICFGIYSILSLSKIFQIMIYGYEQDGLSVLCALLDLVGGVLSFRIQDRLAVKSKTEDDSVS